MSKIYKSIDQLIGNTPMLELANIKNNLNLFTSIFAKLEYFNPTGSVKDRIAKHMLDVAEMNGKIKKGGVIIEPTSGNTGIGLAAIAVARGYKAVIVIPNTMSVERIQLMKAYGAEIVLTDGKLGMTGAIEKARNLALITPDSFIPSQFENLANPEAHKLTTAKEIYDDMQGKIDIFVAGVGTGGTISGVGEYLKERISNIEIIAVEPQSSPVLSTGIKGSHKIQGIGAGFIPKVLNTEIYDKIITVSDEDAFNGARLLAKNEGVLVGISSGAALTASINLAMQQSNSGKKIVTILPDSGNKYMSMDLF